MADLSRYAWADYLDCMDGLPDPVILPRATHAPRRTWPTLVPGLILVAVVATAAIFLSELPFAPFTLSGGRHPIEPVMVAIVLGMILASALPLPKLLQPGLKFTAKRLLPIAIILLGARLDFLAIVRVGAAALGMSLLTIVAGIAMFLLFIKWGWVRHKLGLLLGIGTAICGGTAIVAAAPVIDAKDEDVTFGVATITLVGLVTMFLLPLVAQMTAMSDRAFGIWAGLSIHQTPQVIAAGFAYSQPAGDTATIVKLARVSLLAPALLAIGWLSQRYDARTRIPASPTAAARVRLSGLFPMFILGFLAMALLRTIGWLPSLTVHVPANAVWGAGEHTLSLQQLCETASKLLIIAAMAAVGLETRLSALRQTGWRPLLLSIVAAAGIATAIGVALAVTEH